MAIRDLTGMIADARLHAQDDGTAGNALTDAQWTTILNEIYQAFHSAFHETTIIRADSQAIYFAGGIGTWVPNAAFGVGGINVLNSVPTAGGAGYAANDILSITAGGSQATCRVSGVVGDVVSAVTLLTRGVGYTTGAGKSTSAVAPGTGGGCTVNITSVFSTEGFHVRRVLAMRGAAPLERMEPQRIYELQSFEPTVGGTPKKYALIPNNSSATMTTFPDSFTMLIHPIPAAGLQIFQADYEAYPIDMAGATDLPRGFGDAESRWIPQIAAAKGAWLNGKDQAFVDGILRGVPEEIQTRLNIRDGLLLPRRRPGEVVI